MSDLTLKEYLAKQPSVLSESQLKRMCAAGLVDGAVKRAGAWFVPDDAVIKRRRKAKKGKG